MSVDPQALDVRPSERKQMRKRAKVLQGYDAKPPKCASCVNFAHPIHKGFFRVPFCQIGHFAASPEGVCDLWQGKDGSQLESNA